MSDYLFSSLIKEKGYLSSCIKSIYSEAAPSCFEYHGKWGSLATSKGHYRGFLPYENEIHICVVIGAPVLYFRNNDFLTQPDSSTATQAIYERWVLQRAMNWVHDLSGPFTVLLINKKTALVTVVTDLMAFIPVYSCLREDTTYLGTHVDALAQLAGENEQYDEVSLADFILMDRVTFPYTVYAALRQEVPGSEIAFDTGSRKEIHTYWVPTEENPYATIDEAAKSLRQGIEKYVDTVTENMPRLAQFISAGEDSRALSGLLPHEKPRDAYIFLDRMNREGEIAKRVADVYGAKFFVGYREPLHYLDILPEAAQLVGSGHQYSHAHSLGFNKHFGLANYPAVFGGYLSDSLLKGQYVPKLKGTGRFPFLPQIEISKSPLEKKNKLEVFLQEEVLEKIKKRTNEHFYWLKELRPNSCNEWVFLYPGSMRAGVPNFYSTRRLFKSYEPFLSHEVVRVAAAAPIKWKLNRQLFHRAMRPYLKKSQWILHADGRLPYYPYWVNMPLQTSVWFSRQIKKRLGFQKGNQGPWGDWATVFGSERWQQQLSELGDIAGIDALFRDDISYTETNFLSAATNGQKVNLSQVLWQLCQAKSGRQGNDSKSFEQPNNCRF